MLNPFPQHERVNAVFLHDGSATLAVDKAAAEDDALDDAMALEFDELSRATEEVALCSNCLNVVG
jgi:hypothetical protein